MKGEGKMVGWFLAVAKFYCFKAFLCWEELVTVFRYLSMTFAN